jgi:hypothetical protein
MDLRKLRDIMYATELKKEITPGQQNLVLEIFQNYKDTLQVIFMTESEERVKHLIETKVQRKKGNVDMACREIRERFDDASTGRFSQKIKTRKYFPSIAEIINSIYMKNMNGTKSIDSLIKSGIVMEKLKEFIKEYFDSTPKKRREIQVEKIREFKDANKNMSTIIVERFFTTLDQYI